MATEAEKRMHRCCFTGHRPEKLQVPENVVMAALEKEIRQAIADGFRVFISGMARGVDIWAAEIVLRLRDAGEAIRLICKYLPRAVENGADEEAREHLAFASNLAGISFNESGTNIGHSAAHAVGHVQHIPHGICCSNMTPPVIRFASKTYPDKMKKIALLFGVNISSEKISEIGNMTAEAVRKFAADLGIKTFRELGVSREELVSLKNIIYKDALCHAYGGAVTEQDIEELLISAYMDGE